MLFTLLIALAGILLSLSAGLWYSAHRALLDIDETITTIAIPHPFYIERFAEANDLEPEDVLQTIRETVYASDQLQMDERNIFMTLSADATAVPLRTIGFGLEPRLSEVTAQTTSVFAVTIERVDPNYMLTSRWDEETNEIIQYVRLVHTAILNIDEVLHLDEGYLEPARLTFHFNISSDGEAQFEVGKQYILMGNYTPMTLFGASVLAVDYSNVPDYAFFDEVVGMVNDVDDLTDILTTFTGWALGDCCFPMEIRMWTYDRPDHDDDYGRPDHDDDVVNVIEVTDGLENALASDEWIRMQERIEFAQISTDSLQVITTNEANSIYRINQQRHLFSDGRMINWREHRDGARVVMISNQLAERNNLSVGDTVTLELYNHGFRVMTFEFQTGEFGRLRFQTVIVPNSFNRDLYITEPIEFEIVGIMNILTWDISDYALLNNMIIIPDRALDDTVMENLQNEAPTPQHPLMLDTIIVPNGHIDETVDLISSIADGYGGLFRFFDQGYGTLMVALGNLRFGMSWILVLVVAVWISVAFLFSMFYTARKRKEASVLYAIGVSRKDRFTWVFIQSTILILISLGISIAVSLPLLEYIIEMASDLTETFTDSFRDLTLSDAADSGLRSRIPLHRSPLAVIVTAVVGTVLLLVVTGFMSARSAMFKSLTKEVD